MNSSQIHTRTKSFSYLNQTKALKEIAHLDTKVDSPKVWLKKAHEKGVRSKSRLKKAATKANPKKETLVSVFEN